MFYIFSPIYVKLLLSVSEIFSLISTISFSVKPVFSSEYVLKIAEFQYLSGGRILFNKVNVLINEIFTILQVLNPRIYFYSGGASSFSPATVEPIAVLMFPLFILGVINLIHKNQKGLFLLLILFAVFNYFITPNNILFLLPIATVYLVIAIKQVPKFFRKPIIIYSVYITIRMLLI